MIRTTTALLAIGLVGCVDEGATGFQGELGGAPASAEDTAGETMDLQQSADAVHGTWTRGPDLVTFGAEEIDDTGSLVEITLELNGLTLVRLHDQEWKATVADGFATATGEDTHLTAADRDVLMAFLTALRQAGLDVETRTGDQLERAVDNWLMIREHHALDHELIDHREDRSHAPHGSACAQLNAGYYYYATHDGWHLWSSEWDHERGEWYVYGKYSSGNYYPSSTWTYHHGGWTVGENPNHYDVIDDGGVYMDGQCLGRCGESCDGNILDGWNSKGVFTVDCMEHDVCVRSGHNMGAGSCDDELFGHTVYSHAWNGASWDQDNQPRCY